MLSFTAMIANLKFNTNEIFFCLHSKVSIYIVCIIKRNKVYIGLNFSKIMVRVLCTILSIIEATCSCFKDATRILNLIMHIQEDPIPASNVKVIPRKDTVFSRLTQGASDRPTRTRSSIDIRNQVFI